MSSKLTRFSTTSSTTVYRSVSPITKDPSPLPSHKLMEFHLPTSPKSLPCKQPRTCKDQMSVSKILPFTQNAFHATFNPRCSPPTKPSSPEQTLGRGRQTRTNETIHEAPTRISLLAREDLLNILVPILESNIVFDEMGTPEKTLFHGTCIPAISMFDYCSRIIEFGNLSHSTLIIAVIYLDRLLQAAAPTKKQAAATMEITNWTAHRVLLSTCVLASKYQDDVYYNNQHMAAVGGVKNEELNDMEIAMLVALNFSLWVSPQVFAEYEKLILSPNKRDREK